MHVLVDGLLLGSKAASISEGVYLLAKSSSYTSHACVRRQGLVDWVQRDHFFAHGFAMSLIDQDRRTGLSHLHVIGVYLSVRGDTDAHSFG